MQLKLLFGIGMIFYLILYRFLSLLLIAATWVFGRHHHIEQFIQLWAGVNLHYSEYSNQITLFISELKEQIKPIILEDKIKAIQSPQDVVFDKNQLLNVPMLPYKKLVKFDNNGLLQLKHRIEIESRRMNTRFIAYTKLIIGRGGFGAVILGQEAQSGSWVAIKMQQTLITKRLVMALREAKILIKLNKAFDYYHEKTTNTFYIIQPLLKKDFIFPASLADKLDFAITFAQQLQILHEHHKTHNDLGFNNTLWDETSKTSHLIDFGLVDHSTNFSYDVSLYKKMICELLLDAYPKPSQTCCDKVTRLLRHNQSLTTIAEGLEEFKKDSGQQEINFPPIIQHFLAKKTKVSDKIAAIKQAPLSSKTFLKLGLLTNKHFIYQVHCHQLKQQFYNNPATKKDVPSFFEDMKRYRFFREKYLPRQSVGFNENLSSGLTFRALSLT